MKFDLGPKPVVQQGSAVYASVDPFDIVEIYQLVTGPAKDVLQFITTTGLEKMAEAGAASASPLLLGLFLVVAKGPTVIKGISYLTPSQKEWLLAYHAWCVSKGIFPPVSAVSPFSGELSTDFANDPEVLKAKQIWEDYLKGVSGDFGDGGDQWVLPQWLGDP